MIAKSTQRNGLYLCALFLPLALLYFFPFFALRYTNIMRWTPSAMSRMLEYGFQVRGEDADVVILGESSALFGIDPQQMSADLHVRVISLGNTLMSLPVTGEMELDHYLRNNRRPKVLIFYIVPWNLDYEHGDLSRLYDGEEMLVRHGTEKQALAFASHHVQQVLVFPFEFYVVNDPKHVLANMRSGGIPLSPAEMAGHGRLPAFNALADQCSLSAKLAATGPAMDSSRKLLERYANAADKVLLYVAPIPGCKGTQQITELPYNRLGAAAPRLLPAADFADDLYYSHPLPFAVRTVTQQLTDTIRSLPGATIGHP